MPFIPPTAEEFKTRFPVYSEVADATVNMVLNEAVDEVPDAWGKDRLPGVLYLAAHLIASEGLAGGVSTSDGGVAVTGAIKSRQVGDVRTDYAGVGTNVNVSGSLGRYATSAYGLRYLSLLRKHTPTIFVV